MDEKTLDLLAEFMRTVLARVAENEAHIRDTLLAELKTMIPAPPPPIPGKDGVSVAKATVSDRRLLLTLSDGAVLDAGVVVMEAVPGPAGKDGAPGVNGKDGAPGAPGKDGVGIVKVAVDAKTGHLLLATTEGDEVDAGAVVGPKGEKGDPGTPGPMGQVGEKGMTGPAGPAGLRGNDGKDGEPGKDGAPGINGKDGAPGINGKDGRGIDDLTIRDGALFVKYTDGNKVSLGPVVGDRGERGEKGEPGVPGVPGQSIVGPKGEKGDPARDGAPGVKGDPGRDGKDGTPGRDGKDGITKDQLVEATKEATGAALEAIEVVDGKVLKLGTRTFRLPSVEYKKTWQEGVEYQPGDLVTWAGSMWHCNRATVKKPGQNGDDSGDWILAVKKGADARR